jgi:hypothetical protein
MKMRCVVLFCLLLVINLNAQDQKCACCSDENDQFDFWVGSWSVYDTLDNFIGSNDIVKQYDNCLIQENWKSKGKNRGTSYNYYNPKDSSWNQLWIDNQGTILELKGSFKNGKMILKSDLIKGQKVDWYYNRITWEQIEKGYVKQVWDILDKEDNILRSLFTGIYKPEKE